MIDKFAQKHVILFCIALLVVAMPIVWSLLYLPLAPLGSVWADTVKYTVSATLVITFMCFLWRKRVFSFRGDHFFKSLFTIGLVGLIGAAGAFVFSGDKVDLSPALITILGCIALNLAVAVCEEVLFRGIMLNAMLRAWGGRKNAVPAAVIASSLIFGLRHLLNLLTSPGQILMACAQVVFCFMAGTYLCAVYLRSRNIWVCVTIHFLEDLSTSVWTIFSSAAAVSAANDRTALTVAGMIALQIPYVIFAWLMLRDKKWKYERVSN